MTERIAPDPPVKHLDEEDWLTRLIDTRTPMDNHRVMILRVAHDWATQPRTQDSRFSTHYLFMAEGAGLRLTLKDRVVDVPDMTLFWASPGDYYEVRLRSFTQRPMLYRMRFQILSGNHVLTPWQRVQWFQNATVAIPLLREMLIEQDAPGAYQEEKTRLLIGMLFTEMRRLRREGEQVGRRLHQSQVRSLVEYLSAHIGERPRPSDLAAHLRLSPVYFARLCRATFNISPRRWIMEQRIRHAAQLLLESNQNVSEVAYALGYEDPHFFSRQFKKVMGVGPMAYRKRR